MDVMNKVKNTQSLLLIVLVFVIGIITSCGFDEPEGPDIEAIQRQFNLETDSIDSYIETNSLDVEIDSISEIRYYFIEEGTGEMPLVTDSINVTYAGRFLNELEFDSGTSTFYLRGLLSGWQLIMPTVKEGSTIEFFLPSFYGYGPDGVQGFIPGNTPLIFTVTLNRVVEVP